METRSARYLRQKVVSGTYKWYKISLFTLKRYLCAHTHAIWAANALCWCYSHLSSICAAAAAARCVFRWIFYKFKNAPFLSQISYSSSARVRHALPDYFSRDIYIKYMCALLPLSERWNFDWWLIVINIQDTNLPHHVHGKSHSGSNINDSISWLGGNYYYFKSKHFLHRRSCASCGLILPSPASSPPPPPRQWIALLYRIWNELHHCAQSHLVE